MRISAGLEGLSTTATGLAGASVLTAVRASEARDLHDVAYETERLRHDVAVEAPVVDEGERAGEPELADRLRVARLVHEGEPALVAPVGGHDPPVGALDLEGEDVGARRRSCTRGSRPSGVYCGACAKLSVVSSRIAPPAISSV